MVFRGRFVTQCARQEAKGLLYAGRNAASSSPGMMVQHGIVPGNLPVSRGVRLLVHGNDLLVATHDARSGRGDLSPLQQYKPEVANEEVHLYAPTGNHTRLAAASLAEVEIADRIPHGRSDLLSLKRH